jgi:hypothetical protein
MKTLSRDVAQNRLKLILSLTRGIARQGFNYSCEYPYTGLPDGIFSNQENQFGFILQGLGIEHVGILYGHLEYLAAIW